MDIIADSQQYKDTDCILLLAKQIPLLCQSSLKIGVMSRYLYSCFNFSGNFQRNHRNQEPKSLYILQSDIDGQSVWKCEVPSTPQRVHVGSIPDVSGTRPPQPNTKIHQFTSGIVCIFRLPTTQQTGLIGRRYETLWCRDKTTYDNFGQVSKHQAH